MEHRHGIWYGIAAYVFWGLTPIFWNLVTADAPTLLAHRIVWSAPILAIIISERRQWSVFLSGYATWRSRLTSVAAALLLTVNWGVYVWAVTNERILEASLGYFINPLVSVALGVVILHERLRRLQWMAVAIAAFGVTSMAVMSGVTPWISLILAFSFGTYGLLKKHDATPAPLVSLFGETAVIFLPALLVLLFVIEPDGATFGSSPGASVFLVAAGAVTVIPLLMFGAAAKRIPLSTLGFLQYIAPTMQMLVGLIMFEEAMSTAEMGGFVSVWVALTLFSLDKARAEPVAAGP